MDAILFFLLFLFGLILLPWILLSRSSTKRKTERETAEQHWSELSWRIDSVERSIESIRSELRAMTAAPAVEKTAKETPRIEVNLQKSIAEEPPEKIEETSVAEEAGEEVEASGEMQALPLEEAPTPAELVRMLAQRVPEARPAAPDFSQYETKAPLLDRMKTGFDLEETLGTNWLSKLGIVILVFGIAFFLAYQLRQVGPAGKVTAGFVVSAVLLGGGAWLERKARYVLLARAGIGGGWALAFFTTHAMYYVDATRVLTSQGVDLLLMMIVAAGMVAHSLRYKSQVVTGLAFLLAFSTVTIQHASVYSLMAGAVLALALVVIVLRMRWYELEVFGILAAYLNHFYWLWHIIEPMHGHKHVFPEFIPSAAILLFYWAVFRVSYVVRRIDGNGQEGRNEELVSTAAALLNSFGLLGLMKYQSIHPEWAFWALLALGAAEVGMSLVARGRRRLAFVVLATIGVVLLLAAVPFRFGGMNVSILWVAAAEALLFVGIGTRESVFRRLGLVAAVAASVQMLGVNGARVLGVRWDGAMPGRVIALGIAMAVASAAFYATAVYVVRRWSELFDERDVRAVRGISYLAAALLGTALWVAFPGMETAAAWAVGAGVLAWIAMRSDTVDLRIQGDVLAALAVIRVLAVNLESNAHWGSVSQRLVTVAITAAVLYAMSLLKRPKAWLEKVDIGAGYTWAASTLLGLLLWYELHSVSVAVGWAIFGLVLLELGVYRKSIHLRAQGYVALVSSFCRVYIANLAAGGHPGEISPRLYSTVPIAAILFYAYERMREDAAGTDGERRFHVAEWCAWMGLATVVALVRFELAADWVVVAWAALAGVLMAAAWSTGRRLFLEQSLVLVVVTASRTALHNLYERNLVPAPFLYSRKLCVGATCLLLFAMLTIAYRLRKVGTESDGEFNWRKFLGACVRRPEQVLFFTAFLLTMGLLWAETSRGMLTVSWSAFGVLTFLFALWLGERSFRLAGLGLLLLGVAKIALVDVWSLNPRDRYLTFICMGAALLFVSYLYTRFREAIRQYL